MTTFIVPTRESSRSIDAILERVNSDHLRDMKQKLRFHVRHPFVIRLAKRLATATEA